MILIEGIPYDMLQFAMQRYAHNFADYIKMACSCPHTRCQTLLKVVLFGQLRDGKKYEKEEKKTFSREDWFIFLFLYENFCGRFFFLILWKIVLKCDVYLFEYKIRER